MARKAEIRYVNFYNAGSSAYKFEPVPVPQKKQTMPRPKQRRHKKILLRVDPIALGGVILAFVMLIMMVVGLFQLGGAKKQLNQMQSYVWQLEEKNKALDAEFHAGYDPEEIRQIASEMGMIPVEQAQRVQITVPVSLPEENTSVWQTVYAFLAGLFA